MIPTQQTPRLSFVAVPWLQQQQQHQLLLQQQQQQHWRAFAATQRQPHRDPHIGQPPPSASATTATATAAAATAAAEAAAADGVGGPLYLSNLPPGHFKGKRLLAGLQVTCAAVAAAAAAAATAAAVALNASCAHLY